MGYSAMPESPVYLSIVGTGCHQFIVKENHQALNIDLIFKECLS